MWDLESVFKCKCLKMHKKACFHLEDMLIYLSRANNCTRDEYINSKCQETDMADSTEYYVVKQRALPEVLLKVVEAKKLVESKHAMSVQDAVDTVGISRSSFYKYKDDIFKFHDNTQGTTLTLTFDMDDEPGALSDVLKVIAECGANILTIHQSIPINGVAALSISIQVLSTTRNVSEMLACMEQQEAVHHVKVLARE